MMSAFHDLLHRQCDVERVWDCSLPFQEANHNEDDSDFSAVPLAQCLCYRDRDYMFRVCLASLILYYSNVAKEHGMLSVQVSIKEQERLQSMIPTLELSHLRLFWWSVSKSSVEGTWPVLQYLGRMKKRKIANVISLKNYSTRRASSEIAPKRESSIAAFLAA
jgi:hypothetical protein